MITDEQLKNIRNLPVEDQHKILQEIVNDGIYPVTVPKYCELMGMKGKEKTIYNRYHGGKIKGIEISGVIFVYMNWK